MKATTRTTRWLLTALFFGLLATAGFTLARHHGAPTTANAHATAAPPHIVPQQHAAVLLAAIGGKHTPTAHAGAHLVLEFAHDIHSNPAQSHVSGQSSAPSNTFAGAGRGWGSQIASGGWSNEAQPQRNDHPATSGTNTLPQNGVGDYAYVGYAPLDCELPAGCGGVSAGAGGGSGGGASGGGTGYGGRRPSGTSGALPFVHNSQDSSNSPSDPGPQTNDDTNPPPGNTPNSNSGQGSDPPDQNSNPPAPGTNPAVASAPELDPGTLVAAVTLLFGALAVLLSRRVRAKR